MGWLSTAGMACIVGIVAWVMFMRITKLENDLRSLRNDMTSDYATMRDVYDVMDRDAGDE